MYFRVFRGQIIMEERMKKFCKKVFWYGLISFIVYHGYKFYLKIKAALEIDKTLPLYLKNTVGEEPEISLTIAFPQSILKLGFSKEILNKDKELKAKIEEYINDFYSALSGGKLKLDIYEKAEEKSDSPGKKPKIEEPEIVTEMKEQKPKKNTKK